MEQYTEIAGQDAKKDKKKVEKMKSSDDASAVSGDVEVGSEAGKETMEIGVDRIGASAKDIELAKAIAEKEKTREALMRSWDAKFDAIKESEAAADREKELITRLHINGSLKKEDFEAQMASIQAPIDEAKREADKDLDLAMEYREEIEKMRAEIDESTN